MIAWPIRLSGLLLAALLAACATPVSTKIKASAADVAKYNNLSDLNVVAALERNVNDAKAANMPFLAPHYFQEASKVLSEAQGKLGNKPREELVSTAARGDAILEKGRAVMEIVKYRFTKELELKTQLDGHDTAKLLPKDYERAVGSLSALIEKVEREQANNIDKEKESVQKAMQDLLIRAVQEGALHETEAVNAESKKKNAERQAPATYAEALKVYEEAKKQIAVAHHDQKLVQRLGAQALFAARHAQQINERVAELQKQLNVSGGGGAMVSGAAGSVTGMQVGLQASGESRGQEKSSLEKVVLQEEERLHGIAKTLGLDDLRDHPLDKQAEEIRHAAGELAVKSRSDEVIKDLKVRLKAAEESNQQAAAQLADKDKQLAEKDVQLKALSAKPSQPETAKKPKAAKPRTAKPAAETPKR